MNTINTKFYIAVLVTSLFAFFGGWLIFGVIFDNYYMSNTNAISNILMKDPPVYWAMAISNIAWAILITYVLEKTGSNSFVKGFITGLWVSFLVMLIFDLSIYAFWNIYNLSFLITDIIISSLFWAVGGGLAGAILGSPRRIMVTG